MHHTGLIRVSLHGRIDGIHPSFHQCRLHYRGGDGDVRIRIRLVALGISLHGDLPWVRPNKRFMRLLQTPFLHYRPSVR